MGAGGPPPYQPRIHEDASEKEGVGVWIIEEMEHKLTLLKLL